MLKYSRRVELYTTVYLLGGLATASKAGVNYAFISARSTWHPEKKDKVIQWDKEALEDVPLRKRTSITRQLPEEVQRDKSRRLWQADNCDRIQCLSQLSPICLLWQCYR